MVERKLTALLVVLAVAGCATPQPQFVDQRQYVQAVHDSASKLTWPDGRTPDLDVLAEKSGPGPDKAPAGSERIVLEMTNACAWYLGWEDARDLPEDAHGVSVAGSGDRRSWSG